MDNHSIEILGQKLSYPSSWHGVVSVFFVCSCLVLLAYVIDENRIGAIGDAVASTRSAVNSSTEKTLSEARVTIANQVKEIENMTKAIKQVESKLEKKDFTNLKEFQDLKIYRDNTTLSLDNYLFSQKELNKEIQSLEKLCPECAEVSPRPTIDLFVNPSNLQNSLENLKSQRNGLNFAE